MFVVHSEWPGAKRVVVSITVGGLGCWWDRSQLEPFCVSWVCEKLWDVTTRSFILLGERSWSPLIFIFLLLLAMNLPQVLCCAGPDDRGAHVLFGELFSNVGSPRQIWPKMNIFIKHGSRRYECITNYVIQCNGKIWARQVFHMKQSGCVCVITSQQLFSFINHNWSKRRRSIMQQINNRRVDRKKNISSS